jgi:ATP-dependent protease ClpP protease subunit
MIGAKKKSEPLVGIEDYPVKRPTLDGVTMEQVALTFNPKDYETNEWCPIYQIAKTSHGGIVYFAAINDSVDMIHEYVGLLDTLYEANANDIIEINISSPGGYIATATQICSAINSCKGSVITHASGICASAGSLIWSVGHEVTVGDNALFMWHMSSHFDCGNSLAIKDEAEFQVNYVRDALLSISLKRGFITEEEIARICSNPDETVWIGADEMRERCSKARSDGRLSAQVPHLLSGKAEPAAAVPAEVIGD